MMAKLLGYRQTKGTETDKSNLMLPRHTSTLPVAADHQQSLNACFSRLPMLPSHSPETDDGFFFVGLSHSKCGCRQVAEGRQKPLPLGPRAAPGGVFGGRAWLPTWAVDARPVQSRGCNFPLQPARRTDLRISVGEKCTNRLF